MADFTESNLQNIDNIDLARNVDTAKGINL
jgi:hypothetical protein